jgi:ubiquinone/menaquinone biosynthesis C-methylase UbiE
MSSDQKTVLHNKKVKTSLGQYIFSRQKELILDLVVPHAGERVLDVGCGSGYYLQIFREKWCSVTGIDCSAEMLEASRKRLGDHAELHLRSAEDLPFSDDEFDVVTIINALEIAPNPQKVIAEAIRVCRGRIFIGFLNKYSFVGSKQRIKEIFGFPLAEKIRFFSVEEIKEIVENLIGTPAIKWGSVIYFPAIVYDIFTELEELVPHIRNPLGAFVGLTFPVKYTYRTAQSPIVESYQLKGDAQVTAPEAIRGMLREGNR